MEASIVIREKGRKPASVACPALSALYRMFLVWVSALCLVCLVACDKKEEKRVFPSKGLPYELLVVVEPAVWNSVAGDSLREVLESPVPGLLQHEKMFRLVRVAPRHYERVYVTMRNKLFVYVDPEQPRTRMAVARDVEAAPQWEVTLAAPSVEDLAVWLGQNRERLTDIFVDAELGLEAARLHKKHSKKIADELKALAGYTLCVPEDVASSKRGQNFLWGSTNRNEKDYNIVFYTYPLEGANPFDTEEYVRKRDSVMKKNIPGSTPEKWMTTSREGGQPLVCARRRTLDRDVLEVRGLWEMHRGGIGGPFVAIVYPDTAAGHVVVCEGFVYSPSTAKRELIRTMEAALRTLKQEKP